MPPVDIMLVALSTVRISCKVFKNFEGVENDSHGMPHACV